MVKKEKESKIINIVREGLDYVFQILSIGLFSQVSAGPERVMKNIDSRIVVIEKRIIEKVSSLLVISLGLLFLIFSLFFFLKDFLAWGNSLSFFSIGITIFVMGILLKIIGYGR